MTIFVRTKKVNDKEGRIDTLRGNGPKKSICARNNLGCAYCGGRGRSETFNVVYLFRDTPTRNGIVLVACHARASMFGSQVFVDVIQE
jgi:hypothetical protein